MTRPQRSTSAGLAATRLSLGDGTLAGRSRIATPYDPRRLRRAIQATADASARPVGELIAVSTSGLAVAGAGSGVFAGAASGDVQRQAGFGSVAASGDVPALPVLGTYRVEVDVRWTDGYRGGGVVEVLLDGAAVPSPWPDSGPWGRFVDRVVFAGDIGQTCDVKITPDDAAAHTADVTVRLAVVDTLRTIAAAPPAEMPASASATWTDASTTGNSLNLTLGPPASVVAGELMVACISYQFDAGSTANDSITWDTGWTEVSARDASIRGRGAVATKIADAADEAGSSSYTHNITVTGIANAYIYGSCLTTHVDGSFSAAVNDYDYATGDPANSTVSAAPIAGDYTLAVLSINQQGGGGAAYLSFGFDTAGSTTLANSDQTEFARGRHRISVYPAGTTPIEASASIDTVSATGGYHDLYLHLFGVSNEGAF